MSKIRLMIGNGKVTFKKGKGQLSLDLEKERNGKVISTTIKELLEEASDDDDCGARSVNIEDMEDLPPYDFVKEFKKNEC